MGIYETNFTEEDGSDTIYRERAAFFKTQFPIFVQFLGIYRVLPLTSVECERTFTEVGRNKTKFEFLLAITSSTA